MKIMLVGDVHWCEYSSILREHGNKYSKRLENLILSVSWAEREAKIQNCQKIIYLGDFFDKPDLNSAEITALQDVEWSDLPHSFLVGNHESNSKSLDFSSTKALEKFDFDVISNVTCEYIEDLAILYLPYIMESSRKPLTDYQADFTDIKRKKIIISHNDIKGIQYGAFESKEGFDLCDVENCCDLFINGHIHNQQRFSKNGINIGNLTGQNFSENSFRYPHEIFILDTTSLELTPIENPYAYNFYKIDISSSSDIEKLTEIKRNAVLSIKCNENLKENLERYLKGQSDKICASRTIFTFEASDTNQSLESEIASIDYHKKFCDFCMNHISNSPILLDELSKICQEVQQVADKT